MRSRSRSVAACLAFVSGAAACGEPLQNGGVTIVGDPSSRLGTLCRFRHRTEGSICASEAPEVKPARVRALAGPDDGLRGPFATGRPGDHVLENEEIVVVIDAPDARGGLAASGGHIVDAGDARSRIDALGQVITTLGGLSDQAIYEAITTGTEKDGTAFVEASGRAAKGGSVRVTTRYELSPGSRAVAITTTLLGAGPDAITGLDLGDAVLWGGATGGLGGRDPEASKGAGEIAAPYLFGVGTGVAYALVPGGSTFAGRGGAKAGSIVARAGAGFTTAVEVRGATLAPTKAESFKRALVVAPRGDTVAVATELFYLSGGSPGAVEIAASWEDKAFVRANENRIVLRRACATCPAAPLPDPPSLWLAQPADATAASEIAPGKYTARFEGPGGSSPEMPFEVVAGAVTKVALPIAPGGLLRVRVIEAEPAALAAAIAEQAKTGARPQGTGALQGKATPAKIQVLDAASGAAIAAPVITTNGRAEIALPAGKVRVIASRGPELTIDERIVEVQRSAEAELDLAIARVVDTAGYVACDVGARTAKSLDTPVSLGARLRASAAEGVECVVLAERDPAGDPGPAVEALDLGAHLRAFAAKAIFGAASQRWIGAPAASEDGSSLATLDAWVGRAAPSGDHGLDALWGALAAGRRVTPVAIAFTSSDPAREPGYPRTYVAVTNEDPSKLAASDLASGVAKSDVVLTNGPFVTMRAGEIGAGGVASPGAKRRASIAVHVERAPWVDASELTLFAGGVAAVTVPLPGAKKTERGAIADDVTVPLVFGKGPAKSAPGSTTIFVAEDTYVVAVVRGARSLGPVIGGDPAETKPFAMTSPIWLRSQ